MHDKQQAYQERVEAELKQWTARLIELKAGAQQAKAQTNLDAHNRLEQLQAKEQLARNKLSELKQAGADAWQNLIRGMDGAMQELREAFSQS